MASLSCNWREEFDRLKEFYGRICAFEELLLDAIDNSSKVNDNPFTFCKKRFKFKGKNLTIEQSALLNAFLCHKAKLSTNAHILHLTSARDFNQNVVSEMLPIAEKALAEMEQFQ